MHACVRACCGAMWPRERSVGLHIHTLLHQLSACLPINHKCTTAAPLSAHVTCNPSCVCSSPWAMLTPAVEGHGAWLMLQSLQVVLEGRCRGNRQSGTWELSVCHNCCILRLSRDAAFSGPDMCNKKSSALAAPWVCKQSVQHATTACGVLLGHAAAGSVDNAHAPRAEAATVLGNTATGRTQHNQWSSMLQTYAENRSDDTQHTHLTPQPAWAAACGRQSG